MTLLFTTILAASLAFLTSADGGPTVSLINGTYEGRYLSTFNQDVFLGIPYAQDTSGQNRFRIPQSLNETWSGTRPATNYSNACPDPQPATDAIYGMSEDCLTINIVRPAGLNTSAQLPIMFWIHGGSYQVGTTGLPQYNLSYLVQRSVEVDRPVLGVSINYRKGGWGNMYSIEIQGSGNTNLALRDMRKALAWVSENIAAFGGNPNLVTIWGESSGSFAVGQLTLSFGGRTDDLFHRTIQESGSATTAWCNGTDWYQPIYDDIVTKTNCSDAIDTLACLRTVSYEDIYPLLSTYPLVNGGPGWYPTVDGDIYPEYPTEALRNGRFATSVPHLYGTNSDEGTDNAPADGVINTDDEIYSYLLNSTGFNFPDFTVRNILELYPDDPTVGIPLNTGSERFADKGYQYKRIAAILGDTFYHAPRQDDVRSYTRFAEDSSNTYVYRFNARGWVNATNATYTDTVGGFAPTYKGVAHASEIAFVFNNPRYVGPWNGYEELSDLISELWINFAYDGNPNGAFVSGYSVNDDPIVVTQMLDNVNVTGLTRPYWPAYNEDPRGLNLVLQTQGQGGPYVESDTYRLEGREYLSTWARRRHV